MMRSLDQARLEFLVQRLVSMSICKLSESCQLRCFAIVKLLILAYLYSTPYLLRGGVKTNLLQQYPLEGIDQ